MGQNWTYWKNTRVFVIDFPKARKHMLLRYHLSKFYHYSWASMFVVSNSIWVGWCVFSILKFIWNVEIIIEPHRCHFYFLRFYEIWKDTVKRRNIGLLCHYYFVWTFLLNIRNLRNFIYHHVEMVHVRAFKIIGNLRTQFVSTHIHNCFCSQHLVFIFLRHFEKQRQFLQWKRLQNNDKRIIHKTRFKITWNPIWQ